LRSGWAEHGTCQGVYYHREVIVTIINEEKPDLAGVSPHAVEHLFDILEAQTKIGRAGASTPVIPGLTTSKEWLMTSVPNPTQTRQSIAADYLRLGKEHLERAKTLRLHFVRLARDEGLANKQIGDLLGITEAAVRMMLMRAE
jgi:hypothetical protein